MGGKELATTTAKTNTGILRFAQNDDLKTNNGNDNSGRFLGSFVDHGVEAVAGEEAYTFVEFYCLLVGFGNGEGEGAEA